MTGLLSLLSALSHEQSFSGHLLVAVMSELESDRHSVLASQVSRWEIAIKVGLGRLSVDLAVLEQRVMDEGFQWLAISNDHLWKWLAWKPSLVPVIWTWKKYRLPLN